MSILPRYAGFNRSCIAAGRRGGGLPVQAHPGDLAVAGGRQHGYARPHRRPAADHRRRPAGRHRQPARASGTIGADIAAKANPDGYTITIVEVSHIVMPATTAKLPYDLARDFSPLTLIGVSPMIVFLNAGSPAKSLKDFVALAKAKPGGIPVAHTGIGSFTHLSTELVQTRTGAKFNQVSYKGAAPAMIELAGGQVQMGIFTLASAAGTLKTGRLTPVAIAGDKRVEALPDVPTLGELGMKDMVINQWWGMSRRPMCRGPSSRGCTKTSSPPSIIRRCVSASPIWPSTCVPQASRS